MTTIHLRCLFCFIENSGARICLDGRSQTTEQTTSYQRRSHNRYKRARTQHRRVHGICIWDQDRRCQDNKQKVAEQEIRAPERHFHDLDEELASRLRHSRIAESASVPLACPPCAIRLIMLELTSEEDGDEDFLDRALDGDDRNNTKHSVRCIPKLKEPLITVVSKNRGEQVEKDAYEKLEERNQAKQTKYMRKRCHDRSKFGP